MPGKAAVLLPVAVAILAVWTYRALFLPPPPKPCGTPGGPPVASPRIRLHDGRYLAYREWGVSRAAARHRVLLVHGLVDTKDFSLSASPELVEELGVYFVSYDRPGFGESDPHPSRTVKSTAMDTLELADQLGLADRFYVISVSIGGYLAWSCIKHIPHRLAGVALIVPGVNFWWPSLPANLAQAAYKRLHASDRRTFWIARHAPLLFYAYMNQKLVTPSAILAGHPDVFSRQDKEIAKMVAPNRTSVKDKATQQGVHESFHRDIMVAFSDWGFEPMHLPNPFPRNEGTVHIWLGREDRVVDPQLQYYVAQKLPWVRCHQCSDCGHLLLHLGSWGNAILKGLLLGEEPKPCAA